MNKSSFTSLTEDEIYSLIEAVGKGTPNFTEAQVMILAEWADRVLMDHSIVQGILTGRFAVHIGPEAKTIDDVKFSCPHSEMPTTN